MISAAGIRSMPKALCILGMVISLLLLLIFGLDLVTAMMLPSGSGFPFGGVSWLMDVGFIVCSAVLGYLSWMTFREQV